MVILNAANDNQPQQREYTVGAGNVAWHVPDTPDMTADEVETLCKPLTYFHSLVEQAHALIANVEINEPYSSVYVVSDIYGIDTKIGMAANPVERLAQLQTGNPSRLFIHRLFWVPTRITLTVEQRAHSVAGSKFRRLQGEWFRCSPSEAHGCVASSISQSNCIFCVMTPTEQIWRAA